MSNSLVPELAVTDFQRSLRFYCDVLGFHCRYQRPEEGFAYLEREGAELMLDQIGLGRTFMGRTFGEPYPLELSRLGKGVNLQIRVSAIAPLLAALESEGILLYLPLEEKWYRRGTSETGNKQFMVADPDGYLLRFYEDLGEREIK